MRSWAANRRPREQVIELGLAGKTAIVCGSSSSLGLAIAELLAAEQVNVVMAAHRQDVLEREARRLGGWPVAVDLTLADGAKHLVAHAVQAFGVDILVFNGGGPPPGTALDVTAHSAQATVQLVLLPLIRLVGLAPPHLRSSRSGRILAASSIGIREPTPNIALSNSIRPGMHGYLKTLSNELAPEGITVNILAAGRLATARMSQIFPDGVPPEQLTEIPMGRSRTRSSLPTWPAFWHRIAPHTSPVRQSTSTVV